MKLLIDMNLSHEWVPDSQGRGLGRPNRADGEEAQRRGRAAVDRERVRVKMGPPGRPPQAAPFGHLPVFG